MSAGSAPYIEFKDVRVDYPGHVTGLADVSLSIQKGDFVFFVGQTGAGKSTLIKLLTREVWHTRGIVSFQGRDLSRLSDRDIPGLRREMGIVPQDFALLPRKRVWENVAYAMRAVGHSRVDVRKRVPIILEQVNIGHRADAFPHQLSGGEQQRVAIARALINNPPLLLADEPTGNLDPDRSWEIMELLKALNLKGTTVLVASHDMTVIHRMGRRIVTLENGSIVHDTAPEPQKSAVQMSEAFRLQNPKPETPEAEPLKSEVAEQAVSHSEPPQPESPKPEIEKPATEMSDTENPEAPVEESEQEEPKHDV